MIIGMPLSAMSDRFIQRAVAGMGYSGRQALEKEQTLREARELDRKRKPLTRQQVSLLKNAYKKPTAKKKRKKQSHELIIDLMHMDGSQLDAYARVFSKKIKKSVDETKERIIELKKRGNDFMSSTDFVKELSKNFETKKDVKQLAGDYYKSILTGNSLPFETKQALDLTNGSDLLPQVLRERIVIDYPADNPLREIMQVTTEANLREVAVLKYTANNDLNIEGGSVSFQPIHDRITIKVSESVTHGTNTNLAEAIESVASYELLSREIDRIFAIEPEANKQHMSLYHNDIKTVSGANKFEAVGNALKDLPQQIRNNASIVMSLDDYQDIVKHLGTIGLGGLASNPDMIWGKRLIIIDNAIKPIVGDFGLLNANYEQMLLSNQKDVKDGIITFVLAFVHDIRVLLPTAFRIAETE